MSTRRGVIQPVEYPSARARVRAIADRADVPGALSTTSMWRKGRACDEGRAGSDTLTRTCRQRHARRAGTVGARPAVDMASGGRRVVPRPRPGRLAGIRPQPGMAAAAATDRAPARGDGAQRL